MNILNVSPRFAAGGTAIDSARILIGGAALAGRSTRRTVLGARWLTTCFTPEIMNDGEFAPI